MAEKLETINQFLIDNFGIDTDDSEPIFRVVWSEDQKEMRRTKYTDTGIELLESVVREVPKYGWLNDNPAYILERRVLVPDINRNELADVFKSYEPLWVFHGANGFPVPPTIIGCKLVIDTLYAALGKSSLAKYAEQKQAITNPQENYEANKQRLDELQNSLFGDESGLNQETIGASGSAIVMPQNYGSGKIN